ncbi:MAG: alpha/beta fold hydrolase [Burkholderiales bacterium]
MHLGYFRQRNRRQFLGLAGTLASGLLFPANLRAQTGTGQNPTLIFVHGAMHGAWCWYKILPRLAAAGVPAVAIDLPGRGRNPLPREQQTREKYVESIVQAVDATPGKVVLIGHDVSGLLISLAAEARPEKVARLVYLAAFLPQVGEGLVTLVQRDSESLALKRLVISRDRAAVQLREDSLKEVLYADCDEEDIALARLSLVPEATQPFGAAPALSEARFGRLPKSYMVCAQDRAVGPALQRAMSTAGKCDRIATLESGHAPFFSMPDRLVSALLDAAA